jgi:hypothetical protein
VSRLNVATDVKVPQAIATMYCRPAVLDKVACWQLCNAKQPKWQRHLNAMLATSGVAAGAALVHLATSSFAALPAGARGIADYPGCAGQLIVAAVQAARSWYTGLQLPASVLCFARRLLDCSDGVMPALTLLHYQAELRAVYEHQLFAQFGIEGDADADLSLALWNASLQRP